MTFIQNQEIISVIFLRIYNLDILEPHYHRSV